MQSYLSETYFINHSHPSIVKWVEERVTGNDDLDRAISLYKAVRDEFRYEPFVIEFRRESFQASNLITQGFGHCIGKATFLVACLRRVGIPARLGLAKVRNHLATEKLEKILKTDILVPHGYTDVFLEGKWVKCTPAFNETLCHIIGVAPLEFDGKVDSVFHEYDREGADFMEYIEDYGGFSDLPLELIVEKFKKQYPHLVDDQGNFVGLG